MIAQQRQPPTGHPTATEARVDCDLQCTNLVDGLAIEGIFCRPHGDLIPTAVGELLAALSAVGERHGDCTSDDAIGVNQRQDVVGPAARQSTGRQKHPHNAGLHRTPNRPPPRERIQTHRPRDRAARRASRPPLLRRYSGFRKGRDGARLVRDGRRRAVRGARSMLRSWVRGCRTMWPPIGPGGRPGD